MRVFACVCSLLKALAYRRFSVSVRGFVCET